MTKCKRGEIEWRTGYGVELTGDEVVTDEMDDRPYLDNIGEPSLRGYLLNET
jgi:hypothetical protein